MITKWVGGKKAPGRKGKVRGSNPNGDICTNPSGRKGGSGAGTRARNEAKGL